MRKSSTGTRAVSFALALALFGLVLAGCARTPPEQRLRETLAGLQASVEQRDPGALQGYLAKDFVGPDGLDREQARRMAQVLFLQHRDVGVRAGPQEIVLRDGHATVRFTAALTGGSGRFLPDSAQLYEIESGWRGRRRLASDQHSLDTGARACPIARAWRTPSRDARGRGFRSIRCRQAAFLEASWRST